jgi:hypothetical protein
VWEKFGRALKPRFDGMQGPLAADLRPRIFSFTATFSVEELSHGCGSTEGASTKRLQVSARV